LLTGVLPVRSCGAAICFQVVCRRRAQVLVLAQDIDAIANGVARISTSFPHVKDWPRLVRSRVLIEAHWKGTFTAFGGRQGQGDRGVPALPWEDC